MKKTLKVVICLLCSLLLTTALFACGGGNDTLYSIQVQSAQNGSVQVSKNQAKAGETVTVTATPNEGFVLESVTLNGAPIQSDSNGASFKMPAENVTVTATFIADKNAVVRENMPTLRAFDIEAVSVRTPAQGGWSFVFGATSLNISVWVKDAHIFENADGIKAYFGVVGYDRVLGENNLLVEVLANGTLKTYRVSNGEFVEAQVEGVVACVQKWEELNATSQTGFKITLNVDYQTLGVTAQNAKGNVTLLPAHTNQNMDTNPAKTSILAGEYKIEKPHTYPVLMDDDTYAENPVANKTNQLGDAIGLKAGTYWNTEKDYFDDESEYANRVVTLNGHDNADNNIFFHKTANSKNAYAEATFKVTKVYSNEKYGKFGLMFFDGSSKDGLFFYADAYIGEQNATVSNIVGTELGYNVAQNGFSANWNVIADTDGSFDLETKTITLKMAYKNGKLYLYCGDSLVLAKEYSAGANNAIGIKSFGYGLEVTSYYATNDPTDAKFIAHTPEDTSRKVEVLFVGDNYMANWTAYKYLQIEGGKANEGLSNENVTSLTSKAQSLKLSYTPSNLVVYVGMNDVNNGSTAQTVAGRIQTLVDTYHQLFPTAKVYWVSAIVSPLHSAKATQIAQLNDLVKQMAENDELLEYVEISHLFAQSGAPRANLFAGNGLELNSEYGYSLWSKAIGDALNVQRQQGVDFGDNDENYAYSSGWSFEENGTVAVNNGNNEQVIWYKNLRYSADIYVEAEIYSPRNTGADAYPKAGLVLRNDKFTIFGYVDLAGSANNGNRFMNIVYRPNSTITFEATGNWNWDNQGNGGYGASISEQFVKIAIAKIDNVVYMLANDQVVATFAVPGLEADDQFIVGALNFNRYMQIKNAYGMTDRNMIAEKLGIEIIPTIDLAGATALGGSGSEHSTENLTYTLTQYLKTFNLASAPDYARLYAKKTGAYVVVVNNTMVEKQPVVIKKNNEITYVHDLSEYLIAGENTVRIITADEHTAVTAKIVYGGAVETQIATDSTWSSSSVDVSLPEKPTYYFLGSSVTYGSATNGISFVEKVAQTLGYNVVKEAVSGTTLVDKDASSYVSRLKTMSAQTSVNALIVQLSTNDVTQNLAFGSLSESYELGSFNTLTVIGAIEYIIAYAKQTWNCEVVFYTNPKYNNDRYNALINELYKVQQKWGIGIVDFYNYADMQTLDSATLSSYKADDIHPNVAGYEWMGRVFSEYIQNSLETYVIKNAL